MQQQEQFESIKSRLGNFNELEFKDIVLFKNHTSSAYQKSHMCQVLNLIVIKKESNTFEQTLHVDQNFLFDQLLIKCILLLIVVFIKNFQCWSKILAALPIFWCVSSTWNVVTPICISLPANLTIKDHINENCYCIAKITEAYLLQGKHDHKKKCM